MTSTLDNEAAGVEGLLNFAQTCARTPLALPQPESQPPATSEARQLVPAKRAREGDALGRMSPKNGNVDKRTDKAAASVSIAAQNAAAIAVMARQAAAIQEESKKKGGAATASCRYASHPTSQHPPRGGAQQAP